jgi:hypothetical protein
VPCASEPGAFASCARISTACSPAEPPHQHPRTTHQQILSGTRQQLDPALQKARDAVAAGRKSDLAAALSALLEAAEQAIAALEQSASSPPPDTPGQQPSDAAGPTL